MGICGCKLDDGTICKKDTVWDEMCGDCLHKYEDGIISDQEKRVEARWENGKDHHPEAMRIAKALAYYLPTWNIKFGGDGDSGEHISYAISLWIEDGRPDFTSKV